MEVVGRTHTSSRSRLTDEMLEPAGAGVSWADAFCAGAVLCRARGERDGRGD
jgi:hypothetical protein